MRISEVSNGCVWLRAMLHQVRPQRWGYTVASLVIAIVATKFLYLKLNFSQKYSELIVGRVTWGASNKFHDYVAPYALVAMFAASLCLVVVVSMRVLRSLGEPEEECFHEILVYLCAIFGLWLAGLLTTRSDSLLLVEVSAALIVVALALGASIAEKNRIFWHESPEGLGSLLGSMLSTVLMFGLAVVSIGIGLNRLLAAQNSEYFLPGEAVYRAAEAGLLLGLIMMVVMVWRSVDVGGLKLTLRRYFVWTQLALPPLFLVLVPTPWADGERTIVGYPLGAAGWVVISALMLLAYQDIWRCSKEAEDPATSALRALSPLNVVAILLFFKSAPVGIPSVPSDDYHFGEMLTPWWSWDTFGMTPFWDYAPARGLVNYLLGTFSGVFFDGTAASTWAAWPFVYVAILLLAVPVLSRSMGLMPAMVALLLAPYANGISEIDVVVTVFLCYLCHQFLEASPGKWLLTFFWLGTAAVLFAPGQGALAVVALSPLGCTMAYRLVRSGNKRALAQFLLALTGTLIGVVLTPLGKMIFGAVRYGLEQSSVNSIAHGIHWSASFGVSPDVNPWIFEGMRASWLIVAVVAGAIIVRWVCQDPCPERTARLGFAVPIFVLTLLFVVRAAGRIDAGPTTRLAVASIWALSLLLPLLLFTARQAKQRGLPVFLWVCGAGLVYPHFNGSFASNPLDFYRVRLDPVVVDEVTRSALDNTVQTWPSMGRAVTEPSHTARLAEVRRLLDTVLFEDETYLDLTSRGAQYFYVGRRQPIESGAAYNLVTEAQQKRAIAAIRDTRPPAILLVGDNINHDGGGISLRSNLLYRYVLLDPNYMVVEVGRSVWLVRRDRVDRLDGLEPTRVYALDDSPDSPVNILLRAWDLKWIPVAWGRSEKSLRATVTKVADVKGDKIVTLNAVTRTGDGGYRPIGDDPYVRFDIGDLNLDGRDVGLVSFEFECLGRLGNPQIEVYWSSVTQPETASSGMRAVARDGRLTVPVDATPAWLLTRGLRALRLDLLDKHSCESFRFDRVELLQRRAAVNPQG